jgi:hypothetical protein
MRSELRARFAAAVSRANQLCAGTARLMVKTRELMHAVRNTRHVATLRREELQHERMALTTHRLPTKSVQRPLPRL